MKLTLVQLNPTVGDIDGNVSRILDALERAAGSSPDLVVFPELCVTGYPPKDLLDRPAFVAEAEAALERIAGKCRSFADTGVIVGSPLKAEESRGKGVFNAAVLIHSGKVIFKQAKSLLPTYDVFDEARYFDPAENVEVFPFKGEKLGISICEDAWNDADFWLRKTYPRDPIEILAGKGADLMINIAASPFTTGKERIRFELIGHQAAKYGIPFVMVNQVGGNDDLVFDGRSFFLSGKGKPHVVMAAFEEGMVLVDTSDPGEEIRYEYQEEVESVYRALVLGTRDYVAKCGFERVVLGLSGGIDSAVTCAVAVEAVGPANVTALAMPSPYSSEGSVKDAAELARNLGIELIEIPIGSIMKAYDESLRAAFEGCKEDVTEENIQARIRGDILMAFSNKFGWLPLSTGNKSELAVGYCTLYGDMSGGLAVISDVPKTFVYDLAAHINRGGEVIPENIIRKAPSAELKPGQLDQDTLPPYAVLDEILARYVDEGKSAAEIIAEGFAAATVGWVAEMVRKNEYKRKQAPPGLKVTSKAFGSGRRMPIAARYDV